MMGMTPLRGDALPQNTSCTQHPSSWRHPSTNSPSPETPYACICARTWMGQQMNERRLNLGQRFIHVDQISFLNDLQT